MIWNRLEMSVNSTNNGIGRLEDCRALGMILDIFDEFIPAQRGGIEPDSRLFRSHGQHCGIIVENVVRSVVELNEFP